MTENGNWDALFAQAADIQPESSASIIRRDAEETTTTDHKRGPMGCEKKLKKKKRKRDGQREENDGPYKIMLQSRLDPSPKENTPWSSWMVLEDSFSGARWGACSRWKETSSSKSKCESCGKSALHHRLTISLEQSSNKQQAWPLYIFCCTRNIRCCAKLAAKSGRSPEHFLVAMQNECAILHSMVATFCSQLPSEEANLLQAKLTDVKRLVGLFEYNVKRQAGKKQKSQLTFEAAVRIIIACDALYYRTYYLQLVKMAPIISTNAENFFIPHPQFYFGLEYLCLESMRDGLRWQSELIRNAKEVEATSPDLKILLNHLMLPSKYWDDNHPLTAIHRFRFDETISLFHETGWLSRPSTKDQLQQSLTATRSPGETNHETPAPKLLVEWRDSCRDFLCNLYAYATLSTEVLNRLCDSYFQLEKELKLSKGIIEIGAGTGYIAKQLRDAGALIDAWDIQPTNDYSKSLNEYHGHTPPYYSVSAASSFPRTNAKDMALLLCYPPPESPMAFETFMAYKRAGGKCLIHIGEFKGLTGDKRFESVLLQTMICKTRYPCLGWGTDASVVTVWVESNEVAAGKKQVLLRCSNEDCRNEATKRCRLLRSIVYCSDTCFHQHSTIRGHHLRAYMIDVDGSAMGFNNSSYFDSL